MIEVKNAPNLSRIDAEPCGQLRLRHAGLTHCLPGRAESGGALRGKPTA